MDKGHANNFISEQNIFRKISSPRCSSYWISPISRNTSTRRPRIAHNEEQQRQWVHAELDRISEGHAEQVLEELKIQNTAEHSERLGRFVGYLSRFQDAVDYNRFWELGYRIGSGEVESAHRSVPQKRLKLPRGLLAP